MINRVKIGVKGLERERERLGNMGLEREWEGLEVSILEKETNIQRLRVKGLEREIWC